LKGKRRSDQWRGRDNHPGSAQRRSSTGSRCDDQQFFAEFGTVGGGLFNLTMKSGTNAYHGSAYNYGVNDIMNAAQPYSGLKTTQRRNDYGGTLGGPSGSPNCTTAETRLSSSGVLSSTVKT
jgi:hypothetical protein